ncbi:MAG: DUF817 domain-containing protein [Verrucomicrobiota bacterium]
MTTHLSNTNTLPRTARGLLTLREWTWLGSRQLAACLFGIAMLAGLMMTRNWAADSDLARSDFLFLYALCLQIALLLFRLEHRSEVIVIFAFHLLATGMEFFKTSPEIGSWRYPDQDVLFRVYQVPLFAGFLYSSVGSYIARAWRLLDLRFTHYPPVWATVSVAVLAYANFFTHHFTIDIRWFLIIASFLLFARTQVYFRTGNQYRHAPLLLGLLGLSFAIYLAENIGTFAEAWVYPDQESGWKPVGLGKFWAWYLLMLLSFVLVSLVAKPRSAEQVRS